MPKLLIYRGSTLHHEYSFAGIEIITMGRSSGNDVTLPDPARRVSRCHAAVIRAAGNGERYLARDLGSLRGTFVDGEPVYQHPLKDGSVIEVGGYRLIYSAGTDGGEDVPPIRIVARGLDRGQDRTTRDLTWRGWVEDPGWSIPQLELAESLLQAHNHGISSGDLLREALAPLVGLLEAPRGLAALVYSSGRIQVVARVGLGPREQISIGDPDFLTRLTEGRIVSEEGTLLMPVGSAEELSGFFGLERAKPFSAADQAFLLEIGRLLGSLRPAKRAEPGASRVVSPWPISMVGRTRQAQGVRDQIVEAARSGLNVLIHGETGTGKELVARAIHANSGRKGPFVVQSCAAVPEALAEAEIFGYGPRSGIANADPLGKPGWFEAADQGTLFLDEIQALSIPLQEKLLRALQFKEVHRLGARRAQHVDVQVLAATDQDLEVAIRQGRFREAVYFRFGQQIKVPALRSRRDDIPLLAFYFLDRAVQNRQDGPRTITHRAIEGLQKYPWPGNIRELESAVMLAVSRALDREVLFSWDFPLLAPREPQAGPGAAVGGPQSMREIEKEKIREALEATRGNITRAQQLLGYKSRQTLLNKMDGFGIPRNYGDLEH